MALVLKPMCLRLAIEPSQGYGWSEYDNEEWVRPKVDVGTIEIVDDNNNRRFVCIDRNDDTPWEHATFDPTVRTKPVYTDKSEEGFDPATTGTEVSTETHYGEDAMAEGDQHKFFEVVRSHIKVVPSNENNRGADGFDSSGFRLNQAFELDGYADGERDFAKGIATEIPEDGEIVFGGRLFECRRVKYVLKTDASEYRVTSRSHELISKPKAGTVAERTMGEDSHQSWFMNNRLMSISRNETVLYERVAKTQLSTAATRITGPDGDARSAYQLSADVTCNNSALAATPYSIVVWYKAGFVLSEPIGGALAFTQYGDAFDGWYLGYIRTIGNLEAGLIISSGSEFIELGLYGGQISDATLESYYQDVRRNGGRQYLPLF